jgi:hypothetical protein
MKCGQMEQEPQGMGPRETDEDDSQSGDDGPNIKAVAGGGHVGNTGFPVLSLRVSSA